MKIKTVSEIMLTLLMLSMIAIITLATLPLNIANAQNEALFKVTIIAPGNANLLRRQWAQMFADSLKQLGIDARAVNLSWVEVFDRVFTPALDMVGKTYDEGGYDIQLVGYTPALVPNLAQIYYASAENWPPTGNNYYLWNHTEANDLMDTYLTTTNITERGQVAQRLQTILYNELPASIIFFAETPTAVTPELGGPALGTSPGGEGWLYFNAHPTPELLTGKTSVVYASTGEFESLIPPLSFSWYDSIIVENIFGGLITTTPDLSDLAVPNLLTSWTPSNNGFNWTWTARTGVKWHDGANFTADDIVFSLWAIMNPDTGTLHQGSYTKAFGDNVKFKFANGTSWTVGSGTREGWVTAVNATTIEIGLPELIPGKPYGFFDPYLLGFANNIIPKHIFEKIPPADWTYSPFNTGEGSIDVGGTTYTGPVGTGPYKWVDFDPVARLVHLEKNLNYWNRTALESAGLFGVTDYYIRFITDKTSALAALKNDEVDMLDPQYQIQADIPTIEASWGKVLLQEGTVVQEAGYNNRHPVFGTGVDTPLGKSNPSRAAEAARYVRTAFDYAIPRQIIIDDLLDGFGTPGAVHWSPTSPYYNASVTPRQYNLTKAKEYLEKAGYMRAHAHATVDVVPNTLNLKSQGQWITCYTELPEGHNVSDIDIYSIRLNDTFPISLLPIPPVPVPTEIGDYDSDGILDLMVKFNRTALPSHIYHTLGITYGNVTLTISGNLTNGTRFEGSAAVTVKFGGDADLNGWVELDDFDIWLDNFGKKPNKFPTSVYPDFNNDGLVDMLDFFVWRENFGATVPPQP